MTPLLDCDVLIVGGGLTGMTLGLLLAQSGVEARVVEKEAELYPLPRAAHIDHEAMRIFQALGLADAIAAVSRTASRYDFLTASGEVLMRFEGMDRIGRGGWPGSNMIHQPSIEAALRKAVQATPRVTLASRSEWTSWRETNGAVESSVETPDGEQAIRSRFVIGCDGARSPVREATRVEIDDLQFDEPWLVIDAIVHDATRLAEINLQICDPARPTTCVLMGPGRHRWEFMLKADETAEDALQDAFVARMLAPWSVEGAITVERKAVYRFNAKVAKTWRKGAIMLAGDAAHLTPPFAGQGLCSGLRDAANLAWKIAAVLRGADDRLLDTYQSEREPHVRGVINTAMMMGRTVCMTDPVAAAQRDTQMLAARAKATEEKAEVRAARLGPGCTLASSRGAGSYFPQPVQDGARLDDVIGAGAVLMSRAAAQANIDAVHAIALDDPRLAPFRSALDAWFEAHAAEAVLVRPDRYVFGTGEAQDLRAAWTRWSMAH